MSLRSFLARRSFHYAWVVAFLTFLTLLIAAGIRATPGVFMVPLEQEFRWSRATISLTVSVNLVLYGLIGPFAATLYERFGIRRTMVFALAFLGVGLGLTTLISQPWQLLLLWGVVVGSGTGVIALVLGAIVANRWFIERRGLVIGILTASTATGQLVFLPLLASIVERFGWRNAALTIAGATFLIIPFIALLMRDKPSQIGLRPLGNISEDSLELPESQDNPITNTINALKLGMRKPDFWLLAGSFFVCGASTNGLISTHLIPACIDHGIPQVQAASLLAVMGIFDFVGTIASGWLSDRWNNRYLLCGYYGLRGLSLIFLPFSFDSFHGLSIFAIFYGLDWIATVPPTVRLTTEVFGARKAGVMFGWIVAAHQIGAATATLIAGALHTELGTYLHAFILSGILCIITALLVLRIDQNPNSRKIITF
ncbi:major facilitator transporter [Calothrix sp. NIES-4071]|nr:major facilitator transporter [Calothrix sp. NIES-4071]BAZ54801.1 major facilitator transporter [Calothrix sp. NIES-4105]